MEKYFASDQNAQDKQTNLKAFSAQFNKRKSNLKNEGRKRSTQSTLSEIYGNKTVIDLVSDSEKGCDPTDAQMEVDSSGDINVSGGGGFGENLLRNRREFSLSKAGALNQKRQDQKSKPLPVVHQSRKIVIGGFQKKPVLPENYAETTWARLKAAITTVFEGQKIEQSLEELYRQCESLCRHKYASFLYDKVQQLLETFMSAEAETFTRTLSAIDDSQVLAHFNRMWFTWSERTIATRSFLLYLDRSVLLHSSDKMSLWTLGQHIFEKFVLDNTRISDRLRASVLSQLQALRETGNAASADVLRVTNCILIHLNAYGELLEKAILESTRLFYKSEHKRWLDEIVAAQKSAQSLEKYVSYIHERISSEALCCSLYWSVAHGTVLGLLRGEKSEHSQSTAVLSPSSRAQIVQIVFECLVNSCLPLLFDEGLAILLDAFSAEVPASSKGAELLYDLSLKLNEIELIKHPFALFIKTTGLQIAQDSSQKDSDVILALLKFHETINLVWRLCFHENETLFDTLKDSFEEFMNANPNKLAEWLAKHMDVLLRPNSKASLDEAAAEAKLDECLILFKFIHGKDLFEAFYKTYLARRLLLNRSYSLEMERSVLIKLRKECGPAFTSKLEVMFKDIETSRDLMDAYGSSACAAESDVGILVNVLSAGIWPSFSQTQVKLPTDLLAAQDSFRKFYLSKHTGRKITWLPSLGNCVVTARLPRADPSLSPLKKELVVTLFQAVVLEHFNSESNAIVRLSFAELQKRTQLDEAELKKTLLSLTMAKKDTRILVKEPADKEITDSCVFSINTSFESPQYRVRINAVQLKETIEEQKQTRERAVMDRVYMIDAAIVRIMKGRKTCSKNELSSLLFEQLKFPMTQADVKLRLESLIDREFLQRDLSDANLFHYLA